MSGIVRPVGGAPAGIYWRRRLLLVAVVLLATAGAFKLIGGGGDEPDASASSSSNGPDADASGAADPESEKDSKAKDDSEPSRDDTQVRSGERDVAVRMRPGDACDPATVSVRPSALADTRAGGPVTLRLGLTTVGDSPCVLSLDKHTPLISVSSGGDLVWTSQRCDDLVDTDEVRLEPGWLSYVDAGWSGRNSRQTCGETADFASPGDYTVQAALLGGEPAKSTISLAEPPEEKDESDKDDKSDRSDKSDSDESDESDNDKTDKSDEKQDDSGESESDSGGPPSGGPDDDRDKQDKQDAESGPDDRG